jgi:hypothetical protein
MMMKQCSILLLPPYEINELSPFLRNVPTPYFHSIILILEPDHEQHRELFLFTQKFPHLVFHILIKQVQASHWCLTQALQDLTCDVIIMMSPQDTWSKDALHTLSMAMNESKDLILCQPYALSPSLSAHNQINATTHGFTPINPSGMK